MNKLFKITASILIQAFIIANIAQAEGVSTLSPLLQLNHIAFQQAFQQNPSLSSIIKIAKEEKTYQEQFPYPEILVDKTDNVLKKTLYSDVNAFRTIIIDSPPTAQFLNELIENTDQDTLPLPWTVDEIRDFAVYLPSVVHKLKENIGKEKLFELTGIDGIADEEKILRSIFQLQTELSQRIATMDSYIVENRGTYKTFLNKIYVYNRITAMFIALGLLKRKDARFMSYKFPRDKSIDLLIEIKKRLIRYLEILPMASKELKKRAFGTLLIADEQTRYGYVDWLKEKLGKNLKAVVLYGSATREEENFNDYDNWIVVNDLDEAYRVLKGVALTFKDGKVLVRGKEGKAVSLNIIPESVFAKIFHFNAVCDRNIGHCKVIYGAIDIFEISEKEIIERSISSVYLRLKTLRAAALWIARAPQKVLGKTALFKYFVKNTQFVMNVCINYLEGLRVISKKEVEQQLRKIGIDLFEYKDNPEYIAQAMIQTAVDSSILHNKYLRNRKPDFSFLSFEAIPETTRQAMLEALSRSNGRQERKLELSFHLETDLDNVFSALIDLQYFNYLKDSNILSLLHAIAEDEQLPFPGEIKTRARGITVIIKEILTNSQELRERLITVVENDKVFVGFRKQAKEGINSINSYEHMKNSERLTQQAI